MLQHATRQVPPPQLDACVDFYRQLGFAPTPTPDTIGGRAVWLQQGPTQIHLMPVEGAEPESGHIGIVVPEYERCLAALRTRGCEIDPRQEHWGSPRAFVTDPAGHVVEVMEFPPERADQPPPVQAA